MKKYDILSLICAIMTLISSLLGFFYSFGGQMRDVLTRNGLTVTILGDGIYQNDTLLKAMTTKGTDIAIVLFSILLLILVFVEKRSKKLTIIKIGILGTILYDSICLSMGVTFNNLFLLYTAIFSTTLFSFIINITKCLGALKYKSTYIEKSHIGSIVFLVLGGCSVLVWLTFIIPAIISHDPFNSIANLEIYSTEPTFVLDLGIIMPSCLICAFYMYKKKTIGFLLSSILYIVLTNVGIILICQTIMQILYGIVLTPEKYIGLVGSFIVLGVIATVLNVKALGAVNGE